MPKDGDGCGAITVKKEAYRLPTFEVVLNAPARTALDAPFQVDLLAQFFAGGLLSDRPIGWRVTQTPYVWSPPGREGFVFSSDSRYSGDSAFRSTPVLSRNGNSPNLPPTLFRRAGREDVEQDRQDRDSKITRPTLALWEADFELVGRMWDVAGLRRARKPRTDSSVRVRLPERRRTRRRHQAWAGPSARSRTCTEWMARRPPRSAI